MSLILSQAFAAQESGAEVRFIEGAPTALASALARQRDAETLTSLSAEGQLLYSHDRVKLDGYHYCSQAVSLAERGEFRNSIRAASKALHLGLTGGNADLVAVSKRDLAIAYSYAGNLDCAEQYAREALQQSARNPHLVAGPTQKVLGDVSVRRGNLSDGIRQYQEAIEAASDKFRPLVQISLANAYVVAGDLAAARAEYARTPVPDNDALRALYRRGQGNLLLAEGKPEEALALYRRALADAKGSDAEYHRLWAHEGIGRSYLAVNDRVHAAEAYASAVALTDQVRARFRSEEFKTGLFGDTQQIFERAIELAMETGDTVAAFDLSEKSRARALLDILRERVALVGAASAIASGTKDLTAIRSALLAGEALVEYHSLADRLLAWVVRPDGIKGFDLALPRETLVARVDALRLAILQRQPGAVERGAELYAALIQSLGIAAGEQLTIVPHGVLHYLPFQALKGSGGYLIETNALVVAPSASVVVQLLAKAVPGNTRLTAFGNPEIEPKYALPGSQREVEKLALLFPDRQIYLKREASKTHFKEIAGNARILHVAAHAEVDAVDP